MSSDWPLVRLGDIISIKHGFAFKGEFFSDTATNNVLVTPGNFAIGGGFKDEKFKYYDGPIPIEYKLKAGDLVVTMTDLSKLADTLGYSALIPEHPERLYLHNQRIGLVDITSQDLDVFYLYFLMRSREYRHHVVSSATGSTVKHTSPSKITSFEFRLPPLEIQKSIGQALMHLEEKTANNHQINQTLEQMAQAIFKSWFVDLEPVKAKIAALEAGGSEDDALLAAMQAIAGSALFATDAADADAQTQLARLQAEHPEQYATLRATAELFPSAMQESELGEIPEGWEVTLSGRVIDVRDGTHDSPKRAEEGFPLVTSKHITSGELKIEDAYLISKLDFDSVNKRSKVDDGDILLTMIGTVGIPFYVNQADVEFAIKNVGLFKTSSNRNLGAFFYLLLKSEKMQSYLDARIAGTTQKYLSLTTLRTLEFILPHEQVLHYFSTLTAPIFNQIEQLIQQNTYLSNTRDTLLPKLLSGELAATTK